MARRRTAPRLAIALFFLLLSTASRPSLAQQQQQGGNSHHHHSKSAGGFTPTTAIVLVVLVSAFVVLTIFSVYINRCAPGRPRTPRRHAPADHYHHHNHNHQAAAQSSRAGLDRDVVESFPTAVYGDVKARVAAASGPLECAVCLAAFEDRDELRVLPACCHVFHPACIDPWLAGAVTCPLCRADLTLACEAAREAGPGEEEDEEGVEEEEERDEARLVAVAAFTPESVASFDAARHHEPRPQCRRTQSAVDAPDRHTLRLPEHVMRELADVRRHRRAASLAGYPDAAAEERTAPGPGWLASFWRSVSWQRQTDAAAEEHGGGGGKRVVPIPETPAESRPSGGSAGAATDRKQEPDFDAPNQV